MDLEEFMLEHGMFVPPEVREMARIDRRQTAETGKGADEPGVLVVDDDHLSRMVVMRALECLQMPILQASTGYQALHILTENHLVALVVLDLVMPGQHGVDTFYAEAILKGGIEVLKAEVEWLKGVCAELERRDDRWNR